MLKKLSRLVVIGVILFPVQVLSQQANITYSPQVPESVIAQYSDSCYMQTESGVIYNLGTLCGSRSTPTSTYKHPNPISDPTSGGRYADPISDPTSGGRYADPISDPTSGGRYEDPISDPTSGGRYADPISDPTSGGRYEDPFSY
ncbi:hypothetical protein [Gloeothece verrucosa]|uniref:Uncharacterized protein n=1 Tax=Gloeothece verrucosa (strain PCC 7822) TaxID=497965 RepID=E0UA00_GLOV7|nr:hypothetical protein [Gloeothece verrucosa]ADN16192.1 hypothetical protein Cyan7822_4274 [Gloeothece verrucosa PCC 7822]